MCHPLCVSECPWAPVLLLLGSSSQRSTSQWGYVVCADSLSITAWCLECRWPVNNTGLNNLCPCTHGFFFNKFSQLFVSTGFPSVDSTNHWAKTIFSHSQVWIPNHWLKIHTVLFWDIQLVESRRWRVDFRVKGFTQIFDCVGSLPHSHIVLGPTAWTPGINSVTFQHFDPQSVGIPGSLRSPVWETRVMIHAALCPHRAAMQLKSHLTCKTFWKPVSCRAKTYYLYIGQ